MRFWLSILLLAAAMSAETLPETPSALESNSRGWKNLLPRDAAMQGWTRVPAGRDTQLSETSPWRVDRKRGLLVCNGTKGGHEYLHHAAQEYGDFILHVEWRFVPVSADARYNSGIMIRDSADGKTWHQAQTGPGGGFLFAEFVAGGEKKRVMTNKEMKENRVKAAGEWNVYEITARGPNVSLWVNGAVTSEMETPIGKGYIGFEAEGFDIEFRNIRIKQLN